MVSVSTKKRLRNICWSERRAATSVVQCRDWEGSSGVFARLLHKNFTQPGSMHVLRCQFRSIGRGFKMVRP